MIKVVLDTNVLISSFWGGNPRKLINFWKEGKITLALSQAVLEEYNEVLVRLGLVQECQELFNLFAKGYYCVFTTKTPRLNLVKEDPSDDRFIECAVAHKAPYLISGDKALLKIKKYFSLKIISPREFLEIEEI